MLQLRRSALQKYKLTHQVSYADALNEIHRAKKDVIDNSFVSAMPQTSGMPAMRKIQGQNDVNVRQEFQKRLEGK